MDRSRAFALAAFTAAALNATALLGSAALLAPGLPPHPPAEAWTYVREHLVAWRIGWGLWMAAAASLALFYRAWGRAVAPEARLARHVALALVAVGLAVDWASEIYLLSVPPVPPADGEVLFADLAFERAAHERYAFLGMGVAANGLYTAAGTVFLLLAFSDRSPFPRGLALASIPVWISGFLLCGATLLDHHPGVEGLTVLTIGGFTAFAAACGWRYWRRPPRLDTL